jgi:hypothetical protein
MEEEFYETCSRGMISTTPGRVYYYTSELFEKHVLFSQQFF